MRDVTIIAAEARARAGKGTARATRLKGRVPGVIYGEKQTPELISVESRDLLKELQKGNFFSRLLNIEFDGKSERVLARDVQLDPVTDRPIHVDFQRVGKGSRIRIFIPVLFLEQDQCPGLKKGGVLNIVRHEVEFFCQPDNIPENISISLAGMEIGHSIHISAFELPNGIKPVIQDRDFTVATIAAPIKEDEVKPAAEAAAAPAAAAPAAAKK
ncbi:MAG TPA: 50S ribosomal protein L25/general stress protein Ctc [Ferrovibrio sp.]|jgi:large subunit ribosomal protein L25|uniref:50S ribosomal protein L25/general stress protein Ctc n=1 Tax=Ferrovibrio sp. TaxID=1917215 RepID=UPI002B4B8C06|nr:50S ribosomal protein L25/general stress protein Ctc [Ferrovibrio sp.]HLT76059.1 50S ribosomal protein L25/general stress protein Ctc [Ferrovibrio sp.]